MIGIPDSRAWAELVEIGEVVAGDAPSTNSIQGHAPGRRFRCDYYATVIADVRFNYTSVTIAREII
jgi:hypothetical protein